jgi:voltage-gated potassium channel
MFTALRAMLRDPEGKIIVVWVIAQILLGTLVYGWLEGWSPVDALYFSVVTLATVGFGDLHPTTDPAKLFTVLYILVGLGVFAAFIAELTKHRAATIARLRPHDEMSDPDAGKVSQGATSPQPTATDEDTRT